MTDDVRKDLAKLASSLRAYIEWQQDAGTLGFPRRPAPATRHRDAVRAAPAHAPESAPASAPAHAPASAPAPAPAPAPSVRARARALPRGSPRPPPPARRRGGLLHSLRARRDPHADRVRARQPGGAALFHRRSARGRRGRAGTALRRAGRATARPDDRRDGPLARARRLHLQHPEVPSAGQSTARARRDGHLHPLSARAARARPPARDRRHGQHGRGRPARHEDRASPSCAASGSFTRGIRSSCPRTIPRTFCAPVRNRPRRSGKPGRICSWS